MKSERKHVIITDAAVPIVLLLIGHGPETAQAYWGPFGNGWNGNGPFSGWMGGGGLGGLGGGGYRYESGYQAGGHQTLFMII